MDGSRPPPGCSRWSAITPTTTNTASRWASFTVTRPRAGPPASKCSKLSGRCCSRRVASGADLGWLPSRQQAGSPGLPGEDARCGLQKVPRQHAQAQVSAAGAMTAADTRLRVAQRRQAGRSAGQSGAGSAGFAAQRGGNGRAGLHCHERGGLRRRGGVFRSGCRASPKTSRSRPRSIGALLSACPNRDARPERE